MVAKYLTVRRGRFYCIFIDFSKAFDSVHHDLLWDKLIRYGIHGNFLSVLRSMYMSLQSCVNTSVGITDFFYCTIGTRQGCMLSPILFSLFINDLVSYTNKVGCEGIYVDEEAQNLNILMYADDIADGSDMPIHTQRQINQLQLFCSHWGLGVNLDKTQIIVFRRGGPLKNYEKWFLDNRRIEVVPHYKYLGLIFSSRLSWSPTKKNQASQGRKALFQLKTVLRKLGGMSLSDSFKRFDTYVTPILLYGSEIWGYEHSAQIQQVHHQFCK